MEQEPPKELFTTTLVSGLQEETRTIYLVGEIDERNAFHFMAALSHLDATPGNIRIVISSVGGDEEYGYAMYDAMRSVRNTIIAEGYGIVASMAAIVFQGADLRRLSPNCEYMVHHGSLHGAPEEIQQDTVLKLAEQIESGNEKYYQILFDNSDLEWDEIVEHCKEEKWFTAKETVEAGLADEVIKPVKKAPRKKRKKKKG